MKIYKFGGASVKDAVGVKNLHKVLKESGSENTLLVVSAMGKTTNAMEDVVGAKGEKERANAIQFVYDYHRGILEDLFDSDHAIYAEIDSRFDQMRSTLETHADSKYNFLYDQVVSFGELLSTQIISAYLNQESVQNTWIDIREIIETDQNYRDARVDWDSTVGNIERLIEPSILYITQGFLGGDPQGFTTTLGREGSDYTAAILAYGLNADSVTIWKDVPGVLNADPRYFQETQLLHHISYREAIELAFYGASVIHPKTLQPLQRKEIPLHVKSFKQPTNEGTTVGKGVLLDPMTPCFILKKDQVLLKLSTLDFSFIVERNISSIFRTLHEHRMKVELMQNSAISISMCLDTTFGSLPALLKELEALYKIEFYEGVDLYTIRHFDEESIEKIINSKSVILEQRGRENVQLVVRADAG